MHKFLHDVDKNALAPLRKVGASTIAFRISAWPPSEPKLFLNTMARSHRLKASQRIRIDVRKLSLICIKILLRADALACRPIEPMRRIGRRRLGRTPSPDANENAMENPADRNAEGEQRKDEVGPAGGEGPHEKLNLCFGDVLQQEHRDQRRE
jgi:hypothetical protein